jgi:N-acyl homoserine lactone hydrolase
MPTRALARASRTALHLILSLALSGGFAVSAAGCAATGHGTHAGGLGVTSSAARMEAMIDQPGPAEVETVIGADWAVSRAGLINLDAPAAKDAHLADGDEPIHVFVHVVRHPTRGAFLVDTGVTAALVEDPARAGVSWLVRKAMHPEKMKLATATSAVVARQPHGIAGVLLTHLHLDHVSGMKDVPAGTPLYTGPGEASAHSFMNLFTRSTIDHQLQGQGALTELKFEADPSGRFAGVLDLFGDGSVFALWVPGHTPGSVAYLVRTAHGAVLLTGDACHTRWGWDHTVEPGEFSSDRPASRGSLQALEALVLRHPHIDVRLGHQR